MKKIFITIVAALLFVPELLAQENKTPMSQQIEVTKQYVPEIEGARKLVFSPNIGDTVTLKPDINYSITPTPWKSVFGTEPITAVNISTAEYRPLRPFYLKAGGGYPAQSVLDFYMLLPTGEKGRFGAYVNHYGQWTDRFAGQPPLQTENAVGIYAGTSIGRRNFDFNLNGEYRLYELATYPGAVIGTTSNLGHSSANISFKFGDDFTDFSRFNYRFGIEASGYDSWSLSNIGTGVFADFGWGLGKGAILVGAAFDGWFTNGANDWFVGLTPEYRLQIDKLGFSAGIKLYYNQAYGYLLNDRGQLQDKKENVYIFPKIELHYEFNAALIPYIKFDGELGDGSMDANSRLNPYLTDRACTERPKMLDLGGGLRGSAASRVSYDLYLGYKTAQLPNFIWNNASFITQLTPVDWFYAGADVLFKLPMGFGFEVGGVYNYANSVDNLWARRGNGDVGLGIPAFKLSGTLSYHYRDKFYVKAGVEYATKRFYTAIFNSRAEVPAYVNLKLDVEYKFTKSISAFVTGDNLLNQEMYRYIGYPALGANVMLGVKAVF